MAPSLIVLQTSATSAYTSPRSLVTTPLWLLSQRTFIACASRKMRVAQHTALGYHDSRSDIPGSFSVTHGAAVYEAWTHCPMGGCVSWAQRGILRDFIVRLRKTCDLKAYRAFASRTFFSSFRITDSGNRNHGGRNETVGKWEGAG